MVVVKEMKWRQGCPDIPGWWFLLKDGWKEPIVRNVRLCRRISGEGEELFILEFDHHVGNIEARNFVGQVAGPIRQPRELRGR